MPAYLLVRATDRETPQKPGTYLRGFPVSVVDTNQYLGKQILPNYVQFVITDATPAQIIQYCKQWDFDIDWSFNSHDYVNDTHVLVAFNNTDNVSNSGAGGLTREKVETYLNKWGAIVGTVTQNSVEFTANVLNAIKSAGFWGRLPGLLGIVLNETAYDQGSGVHTIEANYSASGFTALILVSIITDKGCTVTNVDTDNKVITFTVDRATVFNKFKEEVKILADNMFQRRRWMIGEGAMQAAEAAGGSLDVTIAQALTYVQNRLND